MKNLNPRYLEQPFSLSEKTSEKTEKIIFWGILIAIFSAVMGQFFRFKIGSGGILFLDMFLPLLSLFWVMYKIRANGFYSFIDSLKKFPLFWESFLLFSIFSASFFFGIENFSLREILESGFYLFRYSFLLLFVFLVFDVLSSSSPEKNRKKQKIFLISIFSAGFALAILGFLQLKWYPDFREMAKLGWDPHIGRLLSTWFDPNYLGGLFSFLLVLLAGVFSFFIPSTYKKSIQRIQSFSLFSYETLFFITTGVFLLALVFTFSRSALLTFVIPAFFLGIFYFRKVFIFSLFFIAFLLPFSERAMQRIGDGIQSAVSVTQQQPLFLPDATARLRVENFEEGRQIAEKNFWTGIGFNTIRLYRQKNTNASGGFDSSVLTVFVTTGIFGVIAFLWFYFSLFIQALSRIKREKNIVKKGIQRGLAFSLLGVFAQSFFVNFLFFPLFLVFFFGVIGYIFSEE